MLYCEILSSRFLHTDLASSGLYFKTPVFTANERQPWTNYVNYGYEHLIIGAVVRSEYSNIRYLYVIIGNVQKFV